MKILLLFVLITSVSGIHIGCEFNSYNWVVVGPTYACQVTSMDFTDNSTHITGYSGTHLSGNSSTDVKGVLIPYNDCPQFNLTFVPKGFSSIFPNTIALSFERCSIDTLNGDELEEYPNLQWWVLVFSNLTQVPGEFFASTPNINYVAFNYNKIEHVGEGLLDNLQDLEQAQFYGNICINKNALNPSEIPALIEALRVNCTDIEPETTTELTTTTTSTIQPPRCEIDDFEDFVCGLDEEIEVLQGQVGDLQAQVGGLVESNFQLRNEVDELKESKKALQSQVGGLREENEELRDWFLELEQIVIDLSSRPCAC